MTIRFLIHQCVSNIWFPLQIASERIKREIDVKLLSKFCWNTMIEWCVYRKSTLRMVFSMQIVKWNDDRIKSSRIIEQMVGLVQERRNYIAHALELRPSCTNPSRWWYRLPGNPAVGHHPHLHLNLELRAITRRCFYRSSFPYRQGWFVPQTTFSQTPIKQLASSPTALTTFRSFLCQGFVEVVSLSFLAQYIATILTLLNCVFGCALITNTYFVLEM